MLLVKIILNFFFRNWIPEVWYPLPPFRGFGPGQSVSIIGTVLNIDDWLLSHISLERVWCWQLDIHLPPPAHKLPLTLITHNSRWYRGISLVYGQLAIEVVCQTVTQQVRSANYSALNHIQLFHEVTFEKYKFSHIIEKYNIIRSKVF